MVYTLITSELEIWANGMFIIQAAIILRKGLYAWSLQYTTQYVRLVVIQRICFKMGCWLVGSGHWQRLVVIQRNCFKMGCGLVGSGHWQRLRNSFKALGRLSHIMPYKMKYIQVVVTKCNKCNLEETGDCRSLKMFFWQNSHSLLGLGQVCCQVIRFEVDCCYVRLETACSFAKIYFQRKTISKCTSSTSRQST